MTVRTDPPVSEAQRRAMYAAAEGKSNLGISKSVGKEFAEADPGGKLPEHAKDATKKDDTRLDACQAALDELTSRMDAVERRDFSSAGARKAARVLESRGMDSAGRRGDAEEYETSSVFRGKVKVKVLTPPREPGGVARVEVMEGPYKGERFWDVPPDYPANPLFKNIDPTYR